jgi:hypothetical protein
VRNTEVDVIPGELEIWTIGKPTIKQFEQPAEVMAPASLERR